MWPLWSQLWIFILWLSISGKSLGHQQMYLTRNDSATEKTASMYKFSPLWIHFPFTFLVGNLFVSCCWRQTSFSSTLTSSTPWPFLPWGAVPSHKVGEGLTTSVTQTLADTPEVWGPLLPYLSLTETIQPLSHSHHLHCCLLRGFAHNFGCQHLLQSSLLQWFSEYSDTFASENGKMELTFVCWLMLCSR